MKRIVLWFLVFAPLALCAVSAPQDAAGPRYSDPAMNFVAPAGYVQAVLPPHSPIAFDQPTVVAAFAKNVGSPDAVTITILMDNFNGRSVEGFEQLTENILREQIDGVFIRKEKTTLPNGMPAYWVKITMGSGFNESIRWQYEWIDGVRGVALAITARLGTLTEQQARDALSNVSGVVYPRNRY